MKQERIIFTNQKGGVGKTTTCREAGYYLNSQEFDVLFVDCDPQGNLSKSTGYESEKGLYDALETGEIHIHPVTDNLCILPGDFRLSLLEKRYLSCI